MACCCGPSFSSCADCFGLGCPTDSPFYLHRPPTNLYLRMAYSATPVTIDLTVNSLSNPSICTSTLCPSFSETIPLGGTSQFSQLLSACSVQPRIPSSYSNPSLGRLFGGDWYFGAGISLQGGRCVAFFELGSRTLDGSAAQISINFNNLNTGRCSGSVPVTRVFPYTASDRVARVEKEITCVSEMSGMSVTWSPLGASAQCSDSFLFPLPPEACASSATMCVSGGAITMSIDSVSLLP